MAQQSAEADDALAAALAVGRPSKSVAFRGSDAEAGLDLLKDVAALANSGGGVILIGVDRAGTPTGWDPTAFLVAGRAVLTDQLAEYGGEPAGGLEIVPASKGTHALAAVLVHARTVAPIVFQKAAEGAFPRGTVYFRHGQSSEPGTARDVERFVHREVERQRRAWRTNVRKAAAAPADARVLVVKPKTPSALPLTDVRVVDDPNAPVIGRADFDVTHPHRQRDIIRLVNAAIDRPINQFDLLSVKRIHAVEDQPRFFHKPRFSSPQYSDAFVDWLVDSYHRDPTFFERARAEYQASRAG